MKYGVTGASGRFGRVAVAELAKRVSVNDIIAFVRDVERARKVLPAGVEIRSADYSYPDQVASAFEGVDRLLFISGLPGGPVPRLQQHQQVVTAAKKAGVQFIAYTSFPHADTTTAPLASDHIGTEKAIEAAGLAHAFLRNNWYLENELFMLTPVVAQNKPFIYAAQEGQVGWALEREYAEAAAVVLANDQHHGVYEFSGPARSYVDLAAGLSTALGREVVPLALEDEAYAAALVADDGLTPGYAAFEKGSQQAIRHGALGATTTDLTTVLGHELTPLPAALKEILP